MRIRKAWIMVMALGFGMLMPGCKPTEKNYRSAYEAAREKRERDEEHRKELQADLGVDQTALQSVDDDGAMKITLTDIATDEEYKVISKNRSFHRDDKVNGAVAAVATMKMGSNAESLAEDLKKSGFPASRVVRSGDEYIVIIEEDPSAAGLARTAIRFMKKYPEFPYMGQGEMLVIYSR